MKFRLKKDLLWLKAGEIVEIKEADGGKFYLDTSVTHGWIIVSDFPDFFEQVSEEDEKDQEAIKRLESRGWRVVEAMKYSALLHEATQSKSPEQKLVDLLSEKVQDVLNPPEIPVDYHNYCVGCSKCNPSGRKITY